MTPEASVAVQPPAAPLTDGGVVLRTFAERDIDAVIQGCNDADVARWLPALPHPYSESDARAYVESRPAGFELGTELSFAVVDAQDRLLGSAGMPRRDPFNGVSEIGYWVAPWARGQGVATAAVRLLVAWAFDVVGDGRVELMAAPANTASCRVAEKAGLRFEGVLRGREATREGLRRDLAVYGLLATDARPAAGGPAATDARLAADAHPPAGR